jgi:hypothetical protein
VNAFKVEQLEVLIIQIYIFIFVSVFASRTNERVVFPFINFSTFLNVVFNDIYLKFIIFCYP